jgi:hypothetical protein
VRDPGPTLALLEDLRDDPELYVRKSVANHLNDIAKDHPGLVADWLETHLPGASPARIALLRHASRTLIKRCDRRVLAAWGLGSAFRGQATLSIAPRRIRLGESVALTVTLTSAARSPQVLAIDYVVHHLRADGSTSAKVFKGWQKTLPAGGTLALERRHAVRQISIRRYYPGRHRIEVQVNGRVIAEASFDLAA